MARLPAILRLSPKYALASNAAFFAKAVARAAAKPPPPPPNPPQYSSPQVVTSTQWNGGGAPFQHVQTTSSSLPPGYGVYSPEYLQQLQLNTESPIYGPQAPECFDTDFPNFDPLNQDEHFPPVDIVDDAPLTGEEGVELAEELAEQISEGRGLDLLEETDLSRAEAIEQLEAGGYEVESSDWGLGGDNITRTTITDPESGETIHEYYDHDTDRYWIEVTDADGEELSSSGVRDEEGRKVTVSEDEETGGTTTRTEDDLGDGSIIETTVLPDSDVVTVRTVDEDGNSWTVVIAEDGTQTVLEPEQETTREGVEEIVNEVADGQSIEDIAEEQGLTREQVIAQLAAVGFEYESAVVGEGPGYVNTTKIIDQQSGDVIVSHETGPDGTQTSVVIEPNGNVTETVIDTDGTTTTTVTYEQNGITVEEITVDDGETTTTIIDEDGERTELEPEQEPTREGIDEIAADVADGKSIDEIAEERGLSRDQLLAQLRAANYVVEVDTNELANGVELYTTKIVDAEDGEEVIARYSSGRGVEDTSVYLDAEGNEVRRTEYQDGRSVETIIDVDGRRTVTNESADGETTTRVTHNGYTVTTPPDGDLTVRRDEDGVEVTVERGTTLEAMVETLMAVTLDSDDTEDAQAAEVVLAAVERALAGESFEELYGTEDTDGALAEHQKALDDLIEKYGLGQPADRNVTDDNPYGDPPLDPPPSGDDDDWVLMGGHWVDPEVAKAWAELNVLEAELHRAAAEFERSQAQLNLFASDPAYEEALQRAANMLDEALAPHNFRWVPPTPEGSLDDARAQLERAENQLESVSGAVEEFQAVEPLLDEVASAQRAVPDKPLYICTSEDTSADLQRMADEYEQELSVYETAQAKVDALFSRIDLHNAQGGKHLVDYQLLRLEEMSAEVDPNSEAYEGIQEALEEARGEQERAGMQVSVAQGYYDFHAARHDNLQLTVDAYDVREQLLAAYNEDKGFLEEGKTFSTIGGKYLGELTGEQVVEEREDGLWVITHFEKGSTEERLTPEEMDEWWENNRDPELTSQWIDLRDDRQAAHEDVSLAGERLHETLGEQADATLESLDASIEELEQELGELTDPERHGPGSTEMPEELFPEGTEPQEISVEDHELLVTPQMAEEYEERGLEVLLGSDQPMGIEIDGDWRWVHPEVAMTSIALDVARRQRTVVEEVQTALAEQATRYGLMADEPMQRMNESDADFMGRLEYSYLEGDNRDKALDGLYQPLFQALEEEEQGFDSEFSIQSSDADLKTTIEETYGLSGETEEGQEAIDDILDEVRDIGGDSPEVKAIPLFHLDQRGNMSQVMLLAVRSDDGDTRYIDITGRHYSDLGNFRDKNRMFSEDGLLVAPRDLEMRSDDSGNLPLEVVAASKSSTLEKVVDPLVGIGTGVATVLMFTPAAPVAAPLTVAGGLYLGGRAAYQQWDHMRHGGEWNDFESAMNYLSVATTALPVGASAIRALNIRSVLSSAPYHVSMTRGQAFMSSIGGVKPTSTLAQNATLYMSSSGGWNRAARVLDWGAITTGVPLMGMAAQQLIVNGDQMTDLQKTDALMGLMTGFVGTGLGVHGLVSTRPQRSSRTGNDSTFSPRTDSPPSADREAETVAMPALSADVLDAEGGRAVTEPTRGDEAAAGGDTPRLPGEEAPSTSGVRQREVPPSTETVSSAESVQAADAALIDGTTRSELLDTRTEAEILGQHAFHRNDGNKGPYLFRADSRSPGEIEAAGGFHPRKPDRWETSSTLYSYVSANTRGRFVGTSGSVEGIKTFVSKESRVAHEQGYTYVYILNPSRKRHYVPSELERSGHPVSEHIARENEMAIEGSIDWHQVLGWRVMDPSGSFTGEFVRNPGFGKSTAPSAPVAQPRRYFSEETGEVIADQVFGPYPESEANIYVQLKGKPAERGDSPEVADKTHILTSDPQTGERVLVPWIRGAAETHAAQLASGVRPNLPETEGRARVYRLEDLEALNQASQDGALPPGQHVHLIRTRGLDTGAFTLQSGTVPRSGKVGDNGHFQWPEGREVNPINRDGQVYAVVSELSASQVREQFRSGEGLPFAVYAGKDAWLAPGQKETDKVKFQPNQAASGGKQTDGSQQTEQTQSQASQKTGLLEVTLREVGGNENLTAPRFVFRMDSREPSVVFREGFSPRSRDWREHYPQLREAVEAHVEADKSVFVSTSRDVGLVKANSEEGEWIYVMAEPGKGIDVDRYLGPNHQQDKASEVLYDHIPSDRIIGARQLVQREIGGQQGRVYDPLVPIFTGEFVNNPSFQSQQAASPSVRPNLPETEGRARVYRLEDLEALNQASQDGALPPGHHVHLIRARGLDTGAFTLQSGTVPRSGKVGDNGHFRWPEGREVNPVNRDGQVYAVVSELSAGQVREQFRSGEGLPFAVYAGKNAWLMPNRIEANESQQVQPQLNQAAPDGINVTVDSEGVVHLGGVVDNWVSVAGSSYRKRPSLFDKKGASQGLPETVNISRETLEQLLGTEVAKALPDGSEIRVAIGGERDAATSGVTPVRNGDDGVSKSRIWTARGSASAFAGGGLLSIPASYGSDGNGWTGSVLDRTLAPDSPALMLNGAGFVARGVLTAIKARYDNSIRLNNEALDKGEITAQLLNWDVSRIISSRRALGLSKIEAASVGNLAEALWGKYQLLNNLPVTQQSAQRGWTEKAKQQAIDKAVLDYRTEVKKVAGEEAWTINPLDPRTIKSVLFNSAIATTHMINNYVSFQFIMNGGLVDSSAPLFMQIVDKSVLVGFLVANTALGATALAKVGTGLARVDLSSLPGINKATKIGTFAGSALYGVATPPWIAVTLHTATEAFANGNHFLGAMSLASLPFQIGLAYYGLKGFRNDYITMMETVTKDGRVPQLAWPIKTAFAGATIPLTALVSTEAVNQFALGNYAMGGALTSAAVLNAYMISLGSRLSWTDGTVHHGPSLRPLSGAERQRADMQRAILGIGVTLGGAMGTLAMTDVVDWLDEREWVPENEWLTKLRAGDADDEMTEEAGQGRSIYAPFPVIPPASPLTDEGGRIEPQHTPWEEELVLPAAPSFVTQLGDRSVAGGVSAGLGRLDADLEKNRDYYGISVEPGQTLGGLAIRHGVGVEEVVMLNIGHIGDPNSLAPGDRVYLPRTDKVS